MLAKAIDADGITALIGHLDGGPCEDACTWLEEHGGIAVVAEYRDALRPWNERVAGTAG
jgi:hypothetical protein